jgi:hypothetical protein
MTYSPGQPNPLYQANAAQNMAKNAHGHDAFVFQKLAMVTMCIIALASAVQILQQLNRKHDPDRGRGDKVYAWQVAIRGSESSWVTKAFIPLQSYPMHCCVQLTHAILCARLNLGHPLGVWPRRCVTNPRYGKRMKKWPRTT